jgi:hypothetical protein
MWHVSNIFFSHYDNELLSPSKTEWGFHEIHIFITLFPGYYFIAMKKSLYYLSSQKLFGFDDFETEMQHFFTIVMCVCVCGT